jgi:hypothetical protein
VRNFCGGDPARSGLIGLQWAHQGIQETGAKAGLRCFHGWIPLLESAAQFVIKHMSADLKEQMALTNRRAPPASTTGAR